MNIIARYKTNDDIIENEKVLAETFDNATMQQALGILATNFGLQEDESLLVVTDTPLLSVAAPWFYAAKQIAERSELVQLDEVETSGQEPPTEISEMIAEFDVVLLHTSHSLTHTSAGQAIRKHARGASLPGVTADILNHTMNVPYDQIAKRGLGLSMVISSAENMRITSEFGTDLTTAIRQDGVFNDNGIYTEQGAYGNLPAGEVFFAPLPQSTHGIWVVNTRMADHELDEDIILEIQHGAVKNIRGGTAADQLRSKLEAIGDAAFEVAEIGIGTHPTARPDAPVIESEKALRTAHLAVGNSAVIGGENDVPIHLDGITLDPTIEVDHALIMREGEFEISAGFGV